jgi:hypothetical protein
MIFIVIIVIIMVWRTPRTTHTQSLVKLATNTL